MTSIISKLESWANINSYSYNLSGLAQMLTLIESELADLNVKTEILELEPQTYINNQGQIEKRPLGKMLIIRKVNPQATLKVLLGGHMDTVYPPEHSFQSCKQLDSNTLNGPGVADLKGGLLVMIEALKRFEASPHAGKISWTVYVNPDEEIGSVGSAPVLERLAKEHDLGLIYEPSLADGSLAYKRMGTGNFTFVAKGKSAHVGRDFKSGRNSAVAIAELAQALDALNARDATHQSSSANTSNIIINIGNIICEGPLNVVPDLALLRINIRIADNKSGENIIKQIREIINKLSKKHEVEFDFSGSFNRKAKVPDEKLAKLYKALTDCALELGLDIKLRDTGGCCDGNNLWEHGLANIDTLGVRGGKIHSADEFVLIDSIEERIELSYRFLLKLAGDSKLCS